MNIGAPLVLTIEFVPVGHGVRRLTNRMAYYTGRLFLHRHATFTTEPVSEHADSGPPPFHDHRCILGPCSPSCPDIYQQSAMYNRGHQF